MNSHDQTRVTITAGGQTVDTTVAAMKQATADLRCKQGKPAMKHDAEFAAAEDATTTSAAKGLRQFVERFERLEAEKKDLTDDQKEVMAEAKGRGYDTKILRKLIAIRKRDANDLAEEEAVLDMYKAALGM